MFFMNDVSSSLTRQSVRSKAGALECAIQKILEKFNDLVSEIQMIEDESKSYKEELEKQKKKCESKTCSGSEGLKNVIEMAASTTVRITETKNLSTISELLKILCGEVPTLTPPKDSQENKENEGKTTPVKSPKKKSKEDVKNKILSPKKDLNTSAEDISFNEESITEIEGTPGRTSPIIGSKKLKSSSSICTLSGTSVDSREKKKCPNSWPTSEAKQVKLANSPKNAVRGRGRPRQGRLTTFFSKPNHVVDLTRSPEISGGSGVAGNPHVKLLIKQESSDNDDTILPSPTSSAPVANADNSSKALSRDILKQKRSQLSLIKKEIAGDTEQTNSPIISVVDKKVKDNSKEEDLENSINILKPSRFPKSPFEVKSEQSPIKKEPLTNNKLETERLGSPQTTTLKPSDRTPMKLDKINGVMIKIPVKNCVVNKIPVKSDVIPVNSDIMPMKIEIEDNVTHCEEASASILQHGHKVGEPKPMDVDEPDDDAGNSPSKRPLGENRNLANVPKLEDSISLLKPETFKRIEYKSKRKYLQKVEPVYKEPTVRKKCEKMALPAWCCEECIKFFGDLYEDDPDKIAKIVARCSKHRGQTNPARPKTPPGFWEPRWDVPSDTAEFNARNNAV